MYTAENYPLTAASLDREEEAMNGKIGDETFLTKVDLAKYNGEITVYNPKTGEHRTFRVKTALKGKLKGERILSLLVGSDNTADYKGFASVKPDGMVRVWYDYRGANVKGAAKSIWERYADLLVRADHWAAKHGLEYLHSVKCRKCNHPLTDPISISLGIGPVCRGDA
jgi:hypothetical protein